MTPFRSPLALLVLVMAVAVGSLLIPGCRSTTETPTATVEEKETTKTVTVTLRHPGVEANSPETYEMNQLTKGVHVIGYTVTVNSVFCQQDVCGVVPVTLRWDALGKYESFELEKGVELEKVWKDESGDKTEYKAVPFTEEDYQKLHHILSDESSLLKKQKAESLLESRKKAKVDAVSGATPLALADAVIEGGAITCFHLWHWVNGDVKTVATDLTHQRCDEATLTRFLTSDEDHYLSFALQHLTEHRLVTSELIAKVNRVMHGAEKEHFELGYAYLQSALPENSKFMENMATEFSRYSSATRVRLLTRLESEKTIPPKALATMAKSLSTMDRYYEVHLFLGLLEKHNHVTPSIQSDIVSLLDKKNFFISRRAYKFLRKRPVDHLIEERLDHFKQTSEQAGRILD